MRRCACSRDSCATMMHIRDDSSRMTLVAIARVNIRMICTCSGFLACAASAGHSTQGSSATSS